jgi:hypothetical protein
MQVAAHAIIACLHNGQYETKGHEYAIFDPRSPLVRKLRAGESQEQSRDHCTALRLELCSHFLRAYIGINLSPRILQTVDERCVNLQRVPCAAACCCNATCMGSKVLQVLAYETFIESLHWHLTPCTACDGVLLALADSVRVGRVFDAIFVVCSVDVLTQHTAGPQTMAAAMRVMREYAYYYQRRNCYMPPNHGVQEIAEYYAAQPYDYAAPSDTAIDVFFTTELPSVERQLSRREWIELDVQTIAQETCNMIKGQPMPAEPFWRLVHLYCSCCTYASAPSTHPCHLAHNMQLDFGASSRHACAC